MVSKSFDVLRVNNTFMGIIDKTQDEIQGKKCHEILPTPLCHTPDCPLLRIMEENDIHIELDIELTTARGGSSTPFILSAFPFKDSGNEMIGAVINLKDITERKKADPL